jgi:hypothetical protein
MARTVDAVIDETGRVRLLESLSLPSPRRAIVTVLDDVIDESTTTEIGHDAGLPAPWRSRLLAPTAGSSRLHPALRPSIVGACRPRHTS